MLLKLVEYHWAEHLDDALLLLGRLDVKTVPLAGGTHLLAQKDDSIQAVVDLRELELAYITEDARGLHIGAMTTLQNIADAQVLKEFSTGVLARAAQVSSPSQLIRNCATVGGTIGAWTASQADLLTALIALDAEIVVRSGSRTQVNLSGGTLDRPGLALPGVVYKGKQERRIRCADFALERRPNELILEVVVPPVGAQGGSSFLRVGRTDGGTALLNVAALVEIEGNVFKRVRLAFGGVNMEPVRVHGVERQLEGQPVAMDTGNVDTQMIFQALRVGMSEFHPPSDPLVSGAYRRVSGVNLAFRVLEEAINVAVWRGVVSSGRGM